jgi:hypothetical protein
MCCLVGKPAEGKGHSGGTARESVVSGRKKDIYTVQDQLLTLVAAVLDLGLEPD